MSTADGAVDAALATMRLQDLGSVHTYGDGRRNRWLTCAETARLLRLALKAAFPGTKFSVRSQVYAGGASIDVRWTGGPQRWEVEAVAKRFEGARFDGMTDTKEHVALDLESEAVHFGADYVFCERREDGR